MQVVFPSNSDLGLTGSVYNHFGSAPFFVLVDTETNEYQVIPNKDKDHDHGHCRPMKAMDGLLPQAVVVGGIGKGALKKLTDSGVKVFRASEGSVKHNLALLQSQRLAEFTQMQTCGGHGIDGGCSH